MAVDTTDTEVAAEDEHPADPVADTNEVHLVGHLSVAPERRALPSGDEVMSLRLVVRRAAGGIDAVPVQLGPAPPAGSRPRPGQVGRRVLAAAERLAAGDRVVVTGSLRRRWWAAGDARRSRLEVAADRIVPC